MMVTIAWSDKKQKHNTCTKLTTVSMMREINLNPFGRTKGDHGSFLHQEMFAVDDVLLISMKSSGMCTTTDLGEE